MRTLAGLRLLAPVLLLGGLAALPARARAEAPPADPAALAAGLAADIDLSTATAGAAMARLGAIRCAGINPDPGGCRRAIERFLVALEALTTVLERVEQKTRVLVFEDVVGRMSAAERSMLDGRYQALILAVPFPPELSRLLVPEDMAARAQETVDRYYFVADGIWNPAVFAFGDHLMELVARRGQAPRAVKP